MTVFVTAFDVKGLEQALGVKHIVRAEVVFDVKDLVKAKVEYLLEREQADAVVKAISEAKKHYV